MTVSCYKTADDIESADTIEAVFGDNGVFSTEIKDYVKRDGQIEMARAVASCFKDPFVLIAEAGTGTGKTFAYLVPALKAKKNIVISTASKALQDQIILNDIPRLVKLLKLNTGYMVLKGFSNYLCLRNFYESKSLGVLSAKQIKSIEDLIDSEKVLIAAESPLCTFCEVNSRFPKKVTDFITCTSSSCTSVKCMYKEQCFAYLARKKAAASSLVVINHALFFSSLQLEQSERIKGSFLPAYDALIFDEAHSLPEIGRSYFARTISALDLNEIQKDFFDALKKVDSYPKGAFKDQFLLIDEASGTLYNYIKEAIRFIDPGLDKINLLYLKYVSYSEDGDNFEINMSFRQKVGDLYLKLSRLYKLIEENKDICADELEPILARVDEAMGTIYDCMTVDRDKKGNVNVRSEVAWIELMNNGFALTISPLDIGFDFGKSLLRKIEQGVGVVMTSATISVKQSFDKFIYDIGANLIDDHVKTMIVPSVFDYAKNSRLFISESFPPVNDVLRIRRIIDQLESAIDAVKGGIFFLTTSYRALNEAGALLNDRFKDKRKVLVQNSMSISKLMDEFKNDGYAILVGTSSFWEGVDVPGSALSMVIIDKIPFGQPTDPLLQARSASVKKKGLSPFIAISVPEAVIALRQGVGRLIRKEMDTGAMIICDPRLVSSSYGNTFVQSLPGMTRAHNVQDIVEFFNGE